LANEPYNPAICGHEWVGVVSAVGTDVHNTSEGDRVIAGIAPPCGACPECRAERGAYCMAAFLGMVGRDPLAPPHGGFAPRISLDAKRLIGVPSPLTDDAAAMVEPAAVALHAVLRTPPRADDTVLVQGCGPIGLLVLQCVRALGVGRLIAIEPNERRRALALACGADDALTPEEAMPQFARRGADIVFECAGIAPTVQSAVDLVRRGGRVNLVGLASGNATVSPGSWLIKEVSVVASLGYVHHEFGEVINLMTDGLVNVLILHDRTVSLHDLPMAIAELADDPSSATKILVDTQR
jgi:threonine dehydrogenase-like Zn-dependent dehydrogenase